MHIQHLIQYHRLYHERTSFFSSLFYYHFCFFILINYWFEEIVALIQKEELENEQWAIETSVLVVTDFDSTSTGLDCSRFLREIMQ
jgi:hypothetical protein